MKHLISLLLPPICSGTPCSIPAAGSMELYSTTMKTHNSIYQLYDVKQRRRKKTMRYSLKLLKVFTYSLAVGS